MGRGRRNTTSLVTRKSEAIVQRHCGASTSSSSSSIRGGSGVSKRAAQRGVGAEAVGDPNVFAMAKTIKDLTRRNRELERKCEEQSEDLRASLAKRVKSELREAATLSKPSMVCFSRDIDVTLPNVTRTQYLAFLRPDKVDVFEEPGDEIGAGILSASLKVDSDELTAALGPKLCKLTKCNNAPAIKERWFERFDRTDERRAIKSDPPLTFSLDVKRRKLTIKGAWERKNIENGKDLPG